MPKFFERHIAQDALSYGDVGARASSAVLPNVLIGRQFAEKVRREGKESSCHLTASQEGNRSSPFLE